MAKKINLEWFEGSIGLPLGFTSMETKLGREVGVEYHLDGVHLQDNGHVLRYRSTSGDVAYFDLIAGELTETRPDVIGARGRSMPTFKPFDPDWAETRARLAQEKADRKAAKNQGSQGE